MTASSPTGSSKYFSMKKAGLNPMLAYSQGGASTPGGSSVKFENSAKAGVEATLQSIQGQNIRSQTELNSAQAAKAEADTQKIRSETYGNDVNLSRVWSETDKNNSIRALNSAQYNLVLKQVENAIKTGKQIVANTGNTKVDTALKKVQKFLLNAQKAGASNDEAFEKGTGSGKGTGRILIDLLKILNSSKR